MTKTGFPIKKFGDDKIKTRFFVLDFDEAGQYP